MEGAATTGGSGASASMKLVCRVCQKQYANYTCPRCNIRYCSLPCYKGHSLRCTESFMRDNVLTEMKNVEVSSESKRKMLETLKKVYAEENNDTSMIDAGDTDGDAETVLSEETLQKIVAGGELSLADLSLTELKAFKRAVAAGELTHLIKPWEPWWLKPIAKSISLSKHGNTLVQLCDHTGNLLLERSAASGQSEIPPPPAEPLPPLTHLSKVQPSPSLPIHLVEVLYSYCFILRLYNGDWEDNSLDAATDVLTTSNVLSQSALPESVTEAIGSCLETLCSPAFKHAGGYQLGMTLCDDTAAILKIGKAGVICALADLQRMFDSAIRESTVNSGNRNRPKKKELQVASRKIFFMMCWTNESGDTVRGFATFVEAEKHRLAEMRSEKSIAKLEVPLSAVIDEPKKIMGKAEVPRKPVIEEIRLLSSVGRHTSSFLISR